MSALHAYHESAASPVQLEEEGIGDFTAVLTSVAARQASIGLGGRVKDTRAELEAELEKTKRDVSAGTRPPSLSPLLNRAPPRTARLRCRSRLGARTAR